jgi:hypothetical protein
VRKNIITPTPPDDAVSVDTAWLDLSKIARVEVTSEDSDHPVEGVFEAKEGSYWRAASPGKQTIRLVFDDPQDIRRTQVRIEEADCTRMQEFFISWSRSSDEKPREVLRQQWNFSPGGSTIEVENYEVELNDVRVLELNIDPGRGAGAAHATLSAWRVAQ